jgi:hypothetical protein
VQADLVRDLFGNPFLHPCIGAPVEPGPRAASG